MFPPCALVLFHFVLFLLCFPLGKLQLSLLLTLEKGLYLREQDTGQGLWPLPRPFPRAALPLRRETPMSGSEIIRVQKEALQPQWLQGLSVSSGALVSLYFSLYRLIGPPEKAGGPAARQVRLFLLCAAAAQETESSSSSRKRWQRTQCPSSASTHAGSRAQQSAAWGQRVRNRHPLGGSAGLGISPSSRIRSRRPNWPTWGAADSSAFV